MTCAIITTEPNDVMRPIHARMPLMVPTDRYDEWLDARTGMQRARSLIKPWAGPLTRWRISTWLNAARNDGPTCIVPLDGIAPLDSIAPLDGIAPLADLSLFDDLAPLSD